MRASQCDTILAELQRLPGEWIPMPYLALTAHSFNVHSRIAELRSRGHTIENRVERNADSTQSSFYRFVPPIPTQNE